MKKVASTDFGYGNYKGKNRICVVGPPQAFYIFYEGKAGGEFSEWMRGKENQRAYFELKKLYLKNNKEQFIAKVNDTWVNKEDK